MCAGQPFGAVCTVPASVTISGGAVTPFTISVSTLASAAATPLVRPPSAPLQPPGPWQPLVVISLLVMLLASRVPANRRYYRILVPALNAVGAMLLAALLVFPGSAAVVAARRQHLPHDRNNSHSRKQPHPAYFPQVERSPVHNS